MERSGAAGEGAGGFCGSFGSWSTTVRLGSMQGLRVRAWGLGVWGFWKPTYGDEPARYGAPEFGGLGRCVPSVTAAALLYLASRQTVSRTLCALAKGDDILRVSRGVYVATIIILFGRHGLGVHPFH
jgi:hypothetical protein